VIVYQDELAKKNDKKYASTWYSKPVDDLFEDGCKYLEYVKTDTNDW
jgi:hypothetical protein